MDQERWIIMLAGRVQGVNLRWNTMNRARQLGLTGWVCNEPGGTTRIEAEGTSTALKELVAWLETSPGISQVRDIKILPEAGPPHHLTFTIRFL